MNRWKTTKEEYEYQGKRGVIKMVVVRVFEKWCAEVSLDGEIYSHAYALTKAKAKTRAVKIANFIDSMED